MKNVLPFPAAAPSSIVFLPEGKHQIFATLNGKPSRSTVRVEAARGPAIAARLQQDLARRQSANVRPWVDFLHAGGAAAALPKAFRYEPGRGVVLEVEWTDAGRRAIEGRDFSYFSPCFYLADDSEEPEGLPEKGAIGALVNEPAFREIPRIAAADAGNTYAGFTGMDLLEAALAAEAGEADERDANRNFLIGANDARPEVLREVEKIAAGFIARGEAETEAEAHVKAFELRPDLYEAWLNAGATMPEF